MEKQINLQSARIIDLNNFGFEEAGVQRGNPDSLKTNLDYILNGSLVDTNVVRIPESERTSINRNVEENNQIIDEKNSEIEQLSLEHAQIKEYVDELKIDKDAYERGQLTKDGITQKIEVFNLPKFAITSFFLLMLSIFIFFFYVAVVYKALFITPQDIAEAIRSGEWGVSLLPEWAEVYEAFTNNLMVVFAPFIFFCFGIALHLLLESKTKLKLLWCFLILAVTFTLDYLLAGQIFKQVQEANSIMDIETSDKFSDILLVIIMGFVVYIIWSIMYHFWMTELEKRNIPSRLGKIIRNKNVELKKLEQKISAIKGEIKSLTSANDRMLRKLDNEYISMNDILKSIIEFKTGWYRYLNAANTSQSSENLEKCTEVYNKFISTHKLEIQTEQ